MRDTIRDTQATLGRLEALLASGVLTQAEAVSCAGLADALRRPARVAILGRAAKDVTGVLRAMLGEAVAGVVPGGPAVELSFGPAPRHVATFEDGSSLDQDGYPAGDLMSYGPLFVQIEAPIRVLDAMSFLALELDAGPEACAPALAWAAKRSEIAIYCAADFDPAEAAVWAAAPDRLKNHCYLVITGDRDAASARARGLFDAVIHAPAPSEAAATLSALKHRLTADIAAARAEDVDAAELFLHRFRRAELDAGAVEADRLPQVEPEDHPLPPRGPRTPAEPPRSGAAPGAAARQDHEKPTTRAPETQVTPGPSDKASDKASDRASDKPSDKALAAARALVSGPILHLKRRSRALAELLEWREETDGWSEEVLEHCAETAEALRELVSAWPDDDPLAARLRDAIDQACDTVILLQVESGPGQAEDAARVLYQLRTDFEQAMAA
jgi:hypothetical protein